MTRRATNAATGAGLGVSHDSTPDPVNHPLHYTQGTVECIDAIAAALGREGLIAFLRGQVLKYTWRLGAKGPALEDAQKAAWYQARLIATLES